jgi:hypothetical protein
MKPTIVVAAVLLVTGTLFAQTIIPRAGLTLSNSSFKPIDFAEKNSQKPLIGFTVGAGYDLFINDRLSVQPEINFIQKGHISEDVAYPDGYEYVLKSTFRYNYLEVPIMAKFKFGGVSKFYVTAGPSIAMGLGGKYKLSSTFGGLPEQDIESKIHFSDKPNDYDGYDVYADNRFDAGLQAGVGGLLFGKITLDLRYTYGFTDVYDNYSSKNRVLQFSVGVPLNKY